MDWEKIGIIVLVAVLGIILFRGRGGIKKIFEESEAAPKHWGTFIVITLIIIGFVYFLIQM